MLPAPGNDALPDRRRAEGRRRVVLHRGRDDPRRVAARGAQEVHVGEDARHPERGAEQGEGREAREVDLARAEAVESSECLDLGRERAVRVDDAPGGAGAPRREDDRRLVGGGDRFRRRGSRGGALERGERAPAGEPPRADEDGDLDRRERLAGEAEERVGGGDADQRARRDAREAARDGLRAHARIDEHRRRADREQRVDDRDEVGPGTDEDGRAVAAREAGVGEAGGDAARAVVEVGVGRRAPASPALRLVDGVRAPSLRGGPREIRGDVVGPS